jgi:hypothetical protein
MTTFYSVVTFRRCDDEKVKEINVLRFSRKKAYYHKPLRTEIDLRYVLGGI